MKQVTKTILIVFCWLLLFFCLSGVVMTGDFAMHGTVAEKEHFIFAQNVYKLGSLVSIFFLLYLIIFVKNK